MKKYLTILVVVIMIGMCIPVFAKEKKHTPLVKTSKDALHASQPQKQDPKKQEKIQQLSTALTQLIPLAQKINYPTTKLKSLKQQLTSQTGDAKQLIQDTKKEITQVKLFVKAKKKASLPKEQKK